MSAATATKLSLAEILAAYARIEQHIHRTPVLTSKTFDTLSGGLQLFFKCENLQKTGAFKARGACNAVLKAKADLRDQLKGKGTLVKRLHSLHKISDKKTILSF